MMLQNVCCYVPLENVLKECVETSLDLGEKPQILNYARPVLYRANAYCVMEPPFLSNA